MKFNATLIVLVLIAISAFGYFLKQNSDGRISQEECDSQIEAAEIECVRIIGGQATNLYYNFEQEIDLTCGKLLHEIINEKCPVIYEKLVEEYTNNEL